MVSLTKIEEPTDDLFTVQELKDQLRISVASPADEANLQAYLDAATEYVEGVAGCSIMKQRWRLTLDSFPITSKPFLLPRGPLVTLDSFKYIDASGQEQAIAPSGYQLYKDGKPPAVFPPYASFFPTARYVPEAVKLEYTTGMGVDPADVTAPAPGRVRETVRMAVKFLTGHWYCNREPVPIDVVPARLPYSLEAMLWSSRIYRFDWEAYYSSCLPRY